MVLSPLHINVSVTVTFYANSEISERITRRLTIIFGFCQRKLSKIIFYLLTREVVIHWWYNSEFLNLLIWASRYIFILTKWWLVQYRQDPCSSCWSYVVEVNHFEVGLGLHFTISSTCASCFRLFHFFENPFVIRFKNFMQTLPILPICQSANSANLPILKINLDKHIRKRDECHIIHNSVIIMISDTGESLWHFRHYHT